MSYYWVLHNYRVSSRELSSNCPEVSQTSTSTSMYNTYETLLKGEVGYAGIHTREVMVAIYYPWALIIIYFFRQLFLLGVSDHFVKTTPNPTLYTHKYIFENFYRLDPIS